MHLIKTASSCPHDVDCLVSILSGYNRLVIHERNDKEGYLRTALILLKSILHDQIFHHKPQKSPKHGLQRGIRPTKHERVAGFSK